MQRLALVILVLGLLLSLAGQPPAAHAQIPPPNVRVTQIDTSAYPEITLYVSATDANGQPIANLSRADFAVTEDGAPVDLIGFSGGASSGGAHQINTALVIDRSGSMQDEHKLDGAQEAARAFVNQMQSGDYTTLIAFNHRTGTPQTFTNQRDRLERAIDRLRADGGTALYDALVAGVDALEAREGRRVLLVLTDGQDEDSNRSLDTAITYANDYEQPVYVVGLGERNNNDINGVDEDVLRRIAEQTGGEYFYAPGADELAALYARLAGNIQAEYALTYRSPRPFYDGTRRDIQVSIGAAISSGSYTEQHLINVRSNPLVGLLLLLPLLGMLILPGINRRRGYNRPTHDSAAAQSAPISPITVTPGDVPRCRECDDPLTPGAQFCSACGTDQNGESGPTAERRTFCDQCGQSLRPGARFCPRCGASIPAHQQA